MSTPDARPDRAPLPPGADRSAAGPRRPSAVDALAEAHLDAVVAADPYTATALGVSGHEREVTDLSPDGHAARLALARATLRDLDALVGPQTSPGAVPGRLPDGARGPDAALDATDAVTAAALRDRLGLEVELGEAGLDLAPLNVIASSVQGCQEVFDLMATDTEQEWADVAARLAATPGALAGYVQSLRQSARAGHAPARRQVLACADAAQGFADARDGVFARLVAGATTSATDGRPLPAALSHDLAAGRDAVCAAYGRLATFLRDELAPQAREADAVGRDEYALWSRYHVGAALDLDEAYAWGLEEVARIEAEMVVLARQVLPDQTAPTAAQAIAHLEADPGRQVHGTDALAHWMQELSDTALASLAGTHFDIPEPVRRLECRIAPSSSGGIYYTPPSEDFSRPGRMWWSVPPGVTQFGTWRERTTVFHEGVPGHHLQVGQTLYRAELLNRWRRMLCWVSGHGEGWALYAERLMADLGWLDDPGDRMGMLDAALFRAARVVVDIGLHCGMATPPELGGGPGSQETWTADHVWTYLRAHTFQQEDFLRFEHLRYLGWPGQAPSYKLGERLWTSLREESRARAATAGQPFDLAAFHRRALDLGSLPLDVLRGAVLA